MTIPFNKHIFTIWLSEKPTPPDIEKWIATHVIPGYKHTLFTLENIIKVPYVYRAINNKNWVKAADYFRMWQLYERGGIYLDADIEVINPDIFDTLVWLMEKQDGPSLLCEREPNGFIANSFLMARAGQSFLKRFMHRISREHYADNEVWNCGMGAWTDFIHRKAGIPKDPSVVILDPNTYFGKHLVHHFLRSWKTDTT